jgi:hypothetical protein
MYVCMYAHSVTNSLNENEDGRCENTKWSYRFVGMTLVPVLDGMVHLCIFLKLTHVEFVCQDVIIKFERMSEDMMRKGDGHLR